MKLSVSAGIRRLSTVALMIVALQSAAVLPGAAEEPPVPTCPNPTPVIQGMTAAVINPTRPVTGTVNATGCDIWVYFAPGKTGTVSRADIYGAASFGIYNKGARVNITASRIHDISKPGDACGGEDEGGGMGGGGGDDECSGDGGTGVRQYIGGRSGTGILFLGSGASGLISGNTISAYGRRGISVSGLGARAQILANVVLGQPPAGGTTGHAGKTGIWLANGGVAAIVGNGISGNSTGGTSGEAGSGIMIAGGAGHNGQPNYTVGVQITGNVLTGNDVGVLLSNVPVNAAIPTRNLVSLNAIKGPPGASVAQAAGTPRMAGVKVMGGVQDQIISNGITGYATPIYVAPACVSVTVR